MVDWGRPDWDAAAWSLRSLESPNNSTKNRTTTPPPSNSEPRPSLTLIDTRKSYHQPNDDKPPSPSINSCDTPCRQRVEATAEIEEAVAVAFLQEEVPTRATAREVVARMADAGEARGPPPLREARLQDLDNEMRDRKPHPTRLPKRPPPNRLSSNLLRSHPWRASPGPRDTKRYVNSHCCADEKERFRMTSSPYRVAQSQPGPRTKTRHCRWTHCRPGQAEKAGRCHYDRGNLPGHVRRV